MSLCIGVDVVAGGAGNEQPPAVVADADRVSDAVEIDDSPLIGLGGAPAEGDVEVVHSSNGLMSANIVPVKGHVPSAREPSDIETEPQLAAVAVGVNERCPRVSCLRLA